MSQERKPRKRKRRHHLLDHPSFLRFGAFDGPSRVGLDEEFRREVLGGKRFEAGLSVFEASAMPDGRVKLETPDLRRAAYLVSASDYMPSMLFDRAAAIAKGEVYLVAGEVVSVRYDLYDDALGEEFDVTDASLGSDGEPLLEPDSVRVLRAYGPDEALEGVVWAGRPIGDIHPWWSRRTTLRDQVAMSYVAPEEEA